VNQPLFFFLFFFSIFSLCASQEYPEPREVATTEGLPCSLVNQSVCVISGEYTDSALDLVIPGPEPFTVSRVYTSFSSGKPWSFNHYDNLILGTVVYEGTPSYIIAFRQPSSAELDYIFEKKEGYQKLKKLPFKLVVPKGLTNGASVLSGKTNVKNQTLDFYPEEELVVAQSGSGSRKTFKKIGRTEEGWPVCGQVSEEKPNGSRFRYEGKGKGISGAEEIICENKESKKIYSSIKFSEKPIGHEMRLQTLTTSDGRKLSYFFKHHHYRVKEKTKTSEVTTPVDRFYLCKVDHPYAPTEKYIYGEKALSQDLQITAKLRDEGRRFLHIEYYHKGVNHVGGEVGTIDIKEKDDFRLDRVKKLKAPVGTDQTPITTYRFDYHASLKKHKKVGHGYTDVYDAEGHKTRYKYDEEHRLISIIRYSGTDSSTYSPYTKESFIWDDEGCLIAKIFEDGQGNIHHARTFTYDSCGNVLTSTLCGKLTGKPSPPLLLDSEGKLMENGYERETKHYTYSQDGWNLLLSETDSSGKTIRYAYHKKTDLLKAKYLSYDGKIRIREFYFYDGNHALEKKVRDDGCQESYSDLSSVTERHYTLTTPRTEAPVGLPESLEEWVSDFQAQSKIRLKRSSYVYSPQGKLLEEQVFDANGSPVYLLKWEWDLHGNLISETDALGVTVTKRYDPATDNLIEQNQPGVAILNTYDFANRLIEQKEMHADQEFVTSYQYDYLGHCRSVMNPYGHPTHQIFDDFGRVIEIHYPEVPQDGSLVTPIVKTAYDISGFPILQIDANGGTTQFEVNIRGQPTKIIYPDGTKEEMIYSLEGWLVQKIAKNGTCTEYRRDPLGRVTQEIVYGGDAVKQTMNRYNAFHLVESIDPEGNRTTFSYDPAGRLKEILKNDQRIEHFYDSLGRLSEIREYHGSGPHDYRATMRKYDNQGRIIEERLQTAAGETLHFSCYAYDMRGNQTLAQTGDQKTMTEYNTRNQPIKIIDGLGHETHIDYNPHFINSYGQRVLQKTTTDPLGYRTIETYDTAGRVAETIRLNPIGEKVARQSFSYDLLGNQTQMAEEAIENGKVKRVVFTLFAYNPASQIIQITEAAGTPEQKVTRMCYNAYGQKEALIKPDGTYIHYTYDAFERLKTVTSSDQSISYLYEYNLLDQAIRITDQKRGQATEREYFQGEMRKETLANGLTLHYTYDRTGRARTITFPDQTGIEYVYNAVDLKEIYRLMNGQRTYVHKDLEHSLSGQVTKAKLPGKSGVIAYHFDPMGRCQSITSQGFNQSVPPGGFDPAGNLLAFEIQHIPYTFSYDDHYQIASEKGHCSHTYTFDSLKNRTSKDGEKSQHNTLNQLVKKGKQKLVYDPNGNLIRKGSYQYAYDALNRLVKVSDNDMWITYSYDAFDRRIAKTLNGEEELFLYQGQEEIGRWKNGICQEIRLIGKNKQSRTAALEIQGVPYVPIHDMSGNISMLLNLQGKVMEQYRYTVYGEREILGPSGEKRLCSAIGNPWQYAGKRMDEESGLIAFGMRDYDPQLGRWISPDPAGFVDGLNLYAYVHNNPLRYSDSFGLFADALSPLMNGWFPFLEDNFQHFCTSLGPGQINDLQFGNVWHFNIEDKLEAEHNFHQGPFYRTQHYHINDLKDSAGKHYNFKEMPAGKKIVFMCGIGNTYQDFKESLYHIAELSGGYNVEGIFCPTFGLPLDYKCYEYALRNQACFEGSRIFQNIVQEFHANQPPEDSLLAIFHSRGCVYGRNGLIDSPQEARNRVEVAAVAPGGYISRSLCKDVRHFVSTHDSVPRLDKTGRERCQDTIILLQPHPKAHWHDHNFTSPTYAPEIKGITQDYMTR
jgi:RHS repeat-associated protein